MAAAAADALAQVGDLPELKEVVHPDEAFADTHAGEQCGEGMEAEPADAPQWQQRSSRPSTGEAEPSARYGFCSMGGA